MKSKAGGIESDHRKETEWHSKCIFTVQMETGMISTEMTEIPGMLSHHLSEGRVSHRKGSTGLFRISSNGML
jgi:hypothetical protein